MQGWREREVVEHLTMPTRYNEDAFLAELREDAFDFTRLSNRVARRDTNCQSGSSETCATTRSTDGRHPEVGPTARSTTS